MEREFAVTEDQMPSWALFGTTVNGLGEAWDGAVVPGQDGWSDDDRAEGVAKNATNEHCLGNILGLKCWSMKLV